MNQVTAAQPIRETNQTEIFAAPALSYELKTDDILTHLLTTLFTNPSWFERQVAAKKLGDMAGDEAAVGLIEALPNDPFWMVRCAIVQSLERIGNTDSVPALQAVADCDQNNIVRQYAAAAVQRLCPAGYL